MALDPPNTSSSSRTCSATACRPRRATRRSRTNGPRFPKITVYDNVRQQHRLVTEKFGIEKIKLVTGWSMGAVQTFQWGASYPDMVERILPFQGSAKCSRHNFVFLEGVKAALQADAAFKDGLYDEAAEQGPSRRRPRLCGLGLLADVLPARLTSRRWATPRWKIFSSASGRASSSPGRQQSADHALDLAERRYLQQRVFNGDLDKALAGIKAKAIVMPASTDLYFPPEDSEFEVKHMPNAELRVVETDWGHFGGGPGTSPTFAVSTRRSRSCWRANPDPEGSVFRKDHAPLEIQASPKSIHHKDESESMPKHLSRLT